jgi:ABC-type phosphate transport system substrate-binding protein
MLLRLAAILILLAAALPSGGDDGPHQIAVITAADHPQSQLPLAAIKLIFKRKVEIDPAGNRWIPLNLPVHDPIRRAFSLALFDQFPEDMEAYWNEQYFQGIPPPQVLGSEEAVIRFVATTPGAIGYIDRHSVDPRVKVLHTVLIQR